MRGTCAFMLIIGKTTEENQTYFSTLLKCADTGKLRASFKSTLTVVQMTTVANTAMDGKSKSTIRTSLKQSCATMDFNVRRVIATTTTMS